MPGAEHAVSVPPALDAEGVARMLRDVCRASSPEVLVLRATADGVFCRGLAAGTLTVPPVASVRDGLAQFADVLLTLASGPRPSVAVVDGAALGGGVALACACDVVIASHDASFGLPETAAGLPPHLVLAVLARRASVAVRQRLALDSRPIDAADAHRLGLVDTVVDRSALERTVVATVRQLGRVPADAVTSVKSLPALAAPLRHALAEAVESTWRLLHDADVVQALAEQVGAA